MIHTPEERRALGIAVLTAAATTLATGLATWAIEAAKAAVAKRGEKPDAPKEDA